MSKIEELQQQVADLQAKLARLVPKPAPVAHGPDYIENGSARHAAFLGIAEVQDVEQAIKDGYTVYTSPRTQKSYRLEDEIGSVRFYPGVEPAKAIVLVLRQKVNEFEAPDTVPTDAPPMFTGEVWR